MDRQNESQGHCGLVPYGLPGLERRLDPFTSLQNGRRTWKDVRAVDGALRGTDLLSVLGHYHESLGHQWLCAVSPQTQTDPGNNRS